MDLPVAAGPGGRWADWPVAAVSGLAAAAVLMVLDMIFSGAFGEGGPWRTSYMIAPIFLGPDTLQTAGYEFSFGVVAIALAVHYVLGAISGLVLAGVMTPLDLDESFAKSLAAGVIFGIALYLINFYGLAVLFPWLKKMLGWANLAAHVVYGVVVALLYWKLERTGTRTAAS